MKRLLLIAALAGCYDLDRLERLHVDVGGAGADGGAAGFDSGGAADSGPLDASEPCMECGGECISLASDPRHCGACDRDCTQLPGVAAGAVRCVAGVCELSGACQAGRGHCSSDVSDGCETDFAAADHCGGCSVVCGQGFCSSRDGAYACVDSCQAPTPTACGSSCVDTEVDSNHCGACDQRCTAGPNESARCLVGKCVVSCAQDFHSCDGACVSNRNVASCGQSCIACSAPPGFLATCDGNLCGKKCPDGQHSCSEACVSNASVQHCGALCTPCPLPEHGASTTCDGTSCGVVCELGYKAVGGACVELAFTAQTSGTTATLRAVGGSGPSDVWAVGSQTILHSSGDKTWASAAGNAPAGIWYAVWAAAPNDVYIAGDQGIYQSSDGGASWTRRLGSVVIRALWGASANAVYAVGDYPAIYRSIDRDAFVRASSVPYGGLTGVWGSSATDIYATGYYYDFEHSTGDHVWEAHWAGSGTYDFVAVWGSAANNVYLVGGGGKILHRKASCCGAFTEETSGVTLTLEGIWGSGASDVYAVGAANNILRSTDGTTWQKVASGTAKTLLAVWGSGRGDVYAVGEMGTIVHTE